MTKVFNRHNLLTLPSITSLNNVIVGNVHGYKEKVCNGDKSSSTKGREMLSQWNVRLQFATNHQLHMGNDKQSRRKNSVRYCAGTVGVGMKVEDPDRLACQCFHNTVTIQDKFHEGAINMIAPS